jgi:DMSO/TMAO reductase YedYZ heme-binding membrane subunit
MAKRKSPLPRPAAHRENLGHYAVAGLVTLAVVLLIYRYAAVRYGVEGLSTLNKSLATGTAFLLGIVLLLGPLSRLFTVFDHALKFRKELGIMTVFTGAAHVYLSMFPLARRGPFGFYQAQPVSAYTGLAGLVIMVLLLLISGNTIERAIGTKLWWKLQYWGARSAFILTAVHFIVLKYQGMAQWMAGRGSGGSGEGALWLPPISILITVFAAFVLVVRLSELFGSVPARRIIQMSFFTATAYTIWLFL